MKGSIILALSGFIFGGVLTLVCFRAANVQFNPAESSTTPVTSEQAPTSEGAGASSDISVSIDGEEIA